MSQGHESSLNPSGAAAPLSPDSIWSRRNCVLVAAASLASVVLLWVVFFAGRVHSSGPDNESTHQGKSAGYWIEQLKDKDFDTRQAAAKALLAIGSGARSVSPQLEAALKDAAWEFATTLLPELGVNTEMTFQSVGSTIKPLSPEEQRRAAARRKEREEKERALAAKLDKWKDFLVTLLKALEKADPERMQAIKGKVVLEALLEAPKSTSTFQYVSPKLK